MSGDLGDLTRAQLFDYAQRAGLAVTTRDTKAELIAAIELAVEEKGRAQLVAASEPAPWWAQPGQPPPPA